jgi:uncharacterized protein YacL
MFETALLRLGLLVGAATVGYIVPPASLSPGIGTVVGAVCGLVGVGVEMRLRQVTGQRLAGAAIGMTLAALTAAAVFSMLASAPFAQGCLPLVLLYLGAVVGCAKGQRLHVSASPHASEAAAKGPNKILDTSVLIDGRIADILEAGFIEGPLVVPQFVLRELQHVADSSDSSRRARGRRGLDVLQRIQKLPGMRVQIVDDEFEAIRDVDMKLIEVAKVYGGKIVTNDFNLNKVSQVRGVAVLNINELANTVKPVVLPGETLRVFIQKEGKESSQGVAYLDDGTMVVVENARKWISKTVDVTVTSVLQTTAGKMIFGRLEQRVQDANSGAA